jgi:hypothetical protein
MLAFFGGFVGLLIVVIGLLSGVLSVLREFQVMYWKPTAPKRVVFWAFVRIAFIISLGVSWFNAFTSMKGRERDLHIAESAKISLAATNVTLQTRLDEASKSRLSVLPDPSLRSVGSVAASIRELHNIIHSFSGQETISIIVTSRNRDMRAANTVLDLLNVACHGTPLVDCEIVFPNISQSIDSGVPSSAASGLVLHGDRSPDGIVAKFSKVFGEWFAVHTSSDLPDSIRKYSQRKNMVFIWLELGTGNPWK